MSEVKEWSSLLEFPGLDTSQQIKAAATLRVPPREDLASVPPFLIDSEVKSHLSNLYIPSTEEVALIQKFVGMAKAHRYRNYTDRKDYLRRVYARGADEPIFLEPVCLTGPAGVGKSSLMRAVQRILPAPLEITLGPAHGHTRVTSSWLITAEAKSSFAQMLGPYVRPERGDMPKDASKASARIIDKNAVALLMLDEMQFLTLSLTANTTTTNVLYKFSHLGSPLVYVANYSLCRLLQRRPEQDRQRLLASPAVLLPSTPDSEDWEQYLIAVTEALSPTLRVDLASVSPEIYEMTAGLKRLLTKLIRLAYTAAWQDGRRTVERKDLDAAYADFSYAEPRRQVHAMLLSTPSTKNEQYACPFPLPEKAAAQMAQVRAAARQRQLASKIQEDLTVRTERQAAAAIKKIASKSIVQNDTSTPAKPASRRNVRLSASELLATNARRYGGSDPMSK